MSGTSVAAARRCLLKLSGVVRGKSYGMPSFLLHGRFFARFRDDDTVLVLQLTTINERDVLMGLDPDVFFFTDHYRNYPAVLIRLAEVKPALLASVVREAWEQVSAKRSPASSRVKRAKRGSRKKME